MEQANQGFRKTGSRKLSEEKNTSLPSLNTGSEQTISATSSQAGESSDLLSMSMMDPREQLRSLLSTASLDKPFSELSQVTFDHRGAATMGHLLLDTLETQGFSVDDIDAVGALTTAAIPLVDAMIHAAGSRGEILDGFVMDFVYPSIKGPSIAGKRVVLIDAWLSDKSFVQTSSLVTLRKGNALDLDCTVIMREKAQLLAIAALVGNARTNLDDKEESDSQEARSQEAGSYENDIRETGSTQSIKLTDTITGERRELPFVCVFNEEELRDVKVAHA